eukprot:Rhum_TRINITY_DN14310_c25_g1::Rhum_TRINITY_DN14310_c25_g1_i1::g.82295::m.82295
MAVPPLPPVLPPRVHHLQQLHAPVRDEVQHAVRVPGHQTQLFPPALRHLAACRRAERHHHPPCPVRVVQPPPLRSPVHAAATGSGRPSRLRFLRRIRQVECVGYPATEVVQVRARAAAAEVVRRAEALEEGLLQQRHPQVTRGAVPAQRRVAGRRGSRGRTSVRATDPRHAAGHHDPVVDADHAHLPVHEQLHRVPPRGRHPRATRCVLRKDRARDKAHLRKAPLVRRRHRQAAHVRAVPDHALRDVQRVDGVLDHPGRDAAGEEVARAHPRAAVLLLLRRQRRRASVLVGGGGAAADEGGVHAGVALLRVVPDRQPRRVNGAAGAPEERGLLRSHRVVLQVRRLLEVAAGSAAAGAGRVGRRGSGGVRRSRRLLARRRRRRRRGGRRGQVVRRRLSDAERRQQLGALHVALDTSGDERACSRRVAGGGVALVVVDEVLGRVQVLLLGRGHIAGALQRVGAARGVGGAADGLLASGVAAESLCAVEAVCGEGAQLLLAGCARLLRGPAQHRLGCPGVRRDGVGGVACFVGLHSCRHLGHAVFEAGHGDTTSCCSCSFSLVSFFTKKKNKIRPRKVDDRGFSP